jgi:2-polyprenyl-3-methyl-5-hydroxy-6-metoxy-1,4-benzoquinol methylase
MRATGWAARLHRHAAAGGAAGGHFDIVTLWDVIEHVPDPVPLLTEAARVLRPAAAGADHRRLGQRLRAVGAAPTGT